MKVRAKINRFDFMGNYIFKAGLIYEVTDEDKEYYYFWGDKNNSEDGWAKCLFEIVEDFMKIKALDNYLENIKKGEVYEVTDENDEYYYLFGDKKYSGRGYPKYWFKPAEEYFIPVYKNQGLSKVVQEKLFELGYTWAFSEVFFNDYSITFLVVGPGGKEISWSNYQDFPFGRTLLTVDELFANPQKYQYIEEKN